MSYDTSTCTIMANSNKQEKCPLSHPSFPENSDTRIFSSLPFSFCFFYPVFLSTSYPTFSIQQHDPYQSIIKPILLDLGFNKALKNSINILTSSKTKEVEQTSALGNVLFCCEKMMANISLPNSLLLDFL